MLIALPDDWTLTTGPGTLPDAVPEAVRGAGIPATVPGCVHTDLLAAGLIPDPYLDRNESALAWIGRTPWTYRTRFAAEPAAAGERIELVFDGLDTVGRVLLNGTVLGTVANMHRRHRFDVTGLLGPDNELTVEFAAQLDATEEASARLGPRPHTNTHPYNAVRKMACNYEWDWGPDLVTAGIWRPVTLRRWRTARLDDVLPQVTVDGATGTVRVRAGVATAEADAPADLVVRVAVAAAHGSPGGSAEAAAGGDATGGSDRTAVVQLEVPEVARWWPLGHGDQPRYDLTVTLLDAEGAELDRWERRIGFRTVALRTEPDERGTSFGIVVNDRLIQVKGANWIPDDCFPSRVDRAAYARSIGDAVDAGLNLLRVWGGGIYESDDFYDLCDERGVLVWQDFLFACAAYAEEEPLRSEVLAEAREAVTRLAPHPSLAVWNGNNENLWGHEDWDWKEPLGDRTWGAGYYHEELPRIVAELDPTRPYCPGSPWSPDPARHPNDPAHGSMHIWDVWNRIDYTHYRDYVPRFVSEFGYQGPPAWSTLTRAIHDEPLAHDSPGMLAHQKAADGDEKLSRGIAPHLPLPEDFADWHWATQLQQARAVAFGLEHFRSWYPACSGAVVWQLNDCWPVTSWAMVDSDGRRKPLWYAVRHAFAPRLLTIQPRDGGLVLAVCNDTDEAWTAEVPVRRLDLDGTALAEETVRFEAGPRATVLVPLPDAVVRPDDPRRELLVAGEGVERALWYFVEDLELPLRESWEAVDVHRVPDGYQVRVTAAALAKDVCLLADQAHPEAVVDDALVTLLPGESHTFTVRCAAEVPTDEFRSPRVLRSASQLVERHGPASGRPGGGDPADGDGGDGRSGPPGQRTPTDRVSTGRPA
ncbi:glycoside hydrolase family 2 protein [Plantactinospora siamensis]|uniref:beta-mannosidase n=1 Tax=Plantactinospora siamensis TaxID=555372 RepID=A0ABV6NZ90_9ACTN